MKHKNKLIIICILTAFTLNLSACSSSNDLLLVKTAAAESGAIKATIDISGILVAADTVNISPKTGGRVESVNIKVGDTVTAGQVLITLDKRDAEAQVRQAEVAYDAVVNQVAQNKINMEAAEIALAATKKTIPEQEVQSGMALQTAEKNLNNAQKAVDNAVLSYDAAVKRLDNVTILYNAGMMSKTDMETAQTQFDSAKNQLEIATNQYEVVSNAYESAKSQQKLATGATAESQLSAAQSKYDAAKALYETSRTTGIEQAQATLDTVKLQLDNTTITSPINGTVVNINAKPGEMVSSGLALATVVDISSLKLGGTVSQESFAYLKKGDKLDVTVDIYPDRTFAGVISNIGPIAVSSGNYFPIEINIGNSDGDITAGLSAHAALTLNSNAGIFVPSSAVVRSGGETYVFVIKNNIAEKRPIIAGLQNETQTLIINGLEEDEIVAVTNANNLFNNMTVKVQY